MLSERGNGFKIAVNILNIGRIKLGAGVIGACKLVSTQAINYANERVQFGKTIASFGAIKHKLAEMAVKTVAIESAAYRAGQNIDDKINDLLEQGLSDRDAKLKGVEQFAIECAITKILGSESLNYIVDEGVQVYGGMGFSEEAPMARAYRDARITRIYEGTNEINRMLLVGMMLKRAMKGELDLMEPAKAVSKELTSVPSFESIDKSQFFAEEKVTLKNLKKSVLMIAGKAALSFGPKLNDQQEILMNLADMLVEIYATESIMLRAEKLVTKNGGDDSIGFVKLAKIHLSETVDTCAAKGKEAIMAFVSGDEMKVMLMGLKRFTKFAGYNTVELRRQVADELIAANKYSF